MNEQQTERKKAVELAKRIKQSLSLRLGLKLRSRVLTGRNPYIDIRIATDGDVFPNEIRLKIVNKIFENAKVINHENVNYGNIRPRTITLRYSEWAMFFNQETL